MKPNPRPSNPFGQPRLLHNRREQNRNRKQLPLVMVTMVVAGLLAARAANAAQLWAGAAKVDITNTEAGPVNDPLYAKALVLKDDTTTAVIITVDAVAIAEIGSIRNDYLANVRSQLQKELQHPAGERPGQCQPLSRSRLRRRRTADGPGGERSVAEHGARECRRRRRT